MKEKLRVSPNKSLALELKRIENEIDELKKYSRSNVANNIKEVVYHESGHGIQAGRHLPQEQVVEWRRRINKAAENGFNSEWKYKISRYGAETNDILGSQTVIGKKDKYGEFIAESFCAYMKGERSNIFPELPANAAIIAPTIITEEIALVTDIRGVCNDGVTLQTT